MKPQRIGRRFVAAHGALVLCAGLVECVLASLMASPGFAVFGYTAAAILFSLCLLLPAIYLAASVYDERLLFPVANYFLVSVVSIASWLAFWLVRSAPTNLRYLSILAGMHGLLWALWYVRLAFHLKEIPRKAAFLCILAGTSAFLGIVLSTQSQPTQLGAVTAITYYTMFIGIQLLLSAMYLYRELESKVASASRHTYQGGEPFFARNQRRPMMLGFAADSQTAESPSGAAAN
jgi:hypothetical protein